MSPLSPAASLAWKIAAAEAGTAGHASIEPVHLVIGALSLEKVRHAEAEKLGISPDEIESLLRERATITELVSGLGAEAAVVRRALRGAAGRGGGAPKGPLSRSPAAKAAFAAADALAGSGPVSLLHLLAALADRPEASLAEGLSGCGIVPRELAARARAFAGVGSRPAEAPPPEGGPVAAEDVSGSATPTLDRYGRDLTALARRGELPPVVGRRAELLAVVQTLARSTKANPLLVGEPGVGKTAIVEALALRAAAGKDKAVLGERRIVELSLGALLAGTDYRGELEKRLTRILDEVKAHPEVLVFVDEIHAIVGAGRVGQGGQDAASLVKPALARGELRLIGATTPVEYRRQIEGDAALARRFEKIDVPEPEEKETLAILEGLRPRWQSHHGVRIEDEALEAAIALAERFLPERRRPDKAIDLVDRACARARVPRLSMRAEQSSHEPGPLTVDARAVALVLAETRGLPVELVVEGLEGGARARVASLEAFLKERLIGQDAAVERVARRLRLSHSGLGERQGPLAVFLFLGPTGVGKTELARLLAEHLFGAASELVRFDMSEYMEEHAVARLLGAPPGYLGHDEEGQLTQALRAKPYAVVLLDEVEKAHPRIFDVFLQVFDAGRVTDAQGRTSDARHAIFVMTSNLGQGAPRERLGFAAGEEASLDGIAAEVAVSEARRFFRAELLNRVDEILVFRPLDLAAARRILRPLLARFSEAVRARHGLSVVIEPEAEEFVARAGTSPEQGARELVRTVERLVEVPFSGLLVSGKTELQRSWRLVYDEGGVYWIGTD